MVRTQCVHSGTAGSPQKQVMTVAYWLVTLVQCGSSVRQWYACGTLVSHICTPVHWYSVPLVQWGSPVPVALLARHPLESSLADDQFYSLPFILGIHCHWPTPGNTSLKILSGFDIALPILDNNGTFSYFHPYYKSKILLISLINGKQAQKFG